MSEKKSFFKEYIKPILSLTIICLVVTAAVSGTYQLTKPVIEQSLDAASNEARKEVLSTAESFEKIKLDNDTLEQYGVIEAHRSNDNGVAVKVESKGYSTSGNIVLMIGIDSNGTISGIKLLEHSETDGLGTKALGNDYFSQFYGKNESVSDVSPVSGATYSSTGVKNAINNALKLYETVKVGAKNEK